MLTPTTTTLTLTQGDLRQALASVKHSICREETRYYLGGVFIHADRNGMHFVSTDGHRLASATIKTETNLDFTPVIVPAKFVADALKVIKRRDSWSAVLVISRPKVVLA